MLIVLHPIVVLECIVPVRTYNLVSNPPNMEVFNHPHVFMYVCVCFLTFLMYSLCYLAKLWGHVVTSVCLFV